jgi:hypothetical protein
MGNQARASGRTACGRHRIHDREIHRRFHQCLTRLAGRAITQHAERCPSPPLATVGARLRADVSDNLTLIGAVFDGNAAGPGQNDPQLRDRYGVNFRVNDPPLVLGEAQFQWNAKKGDPGLAGKFKVGGWRHFGDFADQRFSALGLGWLPVGQPQPCKEILASTRFSSKNSTGSAMTPTVASEYLRAPGRTAPGTMACCGFIDPRSRPSFEQKARAREPRAVAGSRQKAATEAGR